MKYYAIKKLDDKIVNLIYTDWESCKRVITGVHAVYKSFTNVEDVKKYLKGAVPEIIDLVSSTSESVLKTTYSIKELMTLYAWVTDSALRQEPKTFEEMYNLFLKVLPRDDNGVYEYYTDGSRRNNTIGWAFVLVKDNREIKHLYGKVNPSEETSGNVTGELIAAKAALNDAILNGYKNIRILHDYQGVSSFVTGEYEAKTKESIDYAQFMKNSLDRHKVNLVFKRVAGHTGVRFNELADEYAKQGTITLTNDGAIRKFRGDYGFLSNFHECDLMYEGLHFSNSESLFQSFKLVQNKDYKLGEFVGYTGITGKDAKRLSRENPARDDWHGVSLEAMLVALQCKFSQNERLAQELLNTGDAYLEEDNTWGDKFWGVSYEKGENMLGKLLILVRGELRGENIIGLTSLRED